MRHRGIEPADGEREIAANSRVVVFRAIEGGNERRRERTVGAHLGIIQQPGQFVGGRPATIRSAVLNLREVVLRAPIVCQ